VVVVWRCVWGAVAIRCPGHCCAYDRRVELTESWKRVIPEELHDRYRFVETRNAATNFAAAHPLEFDEMVQVLAAFRIDVDRIVRPGGSKHLIAAELDEAFREFGWREARYDQSLRTRLVLQPYHRVGEVGETVRESLNEYSGHKIDNVKGRVGLDVEWNPKDGNLDRDFGNFRALYEGGALDVGVILTRMAEGMRSLWVDTIATAKTLDVSGTPTFAARLDKTPDDPLGTSTTSNFEKLVPRIERGDGGGCPILAVAITERCFVEPADLLHGLEQLAANVEAGVETVRMATRMGLLDDESGSGS